MIRQAQRENLDNEKAIRNLSDAELDAWIMDRMYDPAAQDGVEESGNVAEMKVKSRL